MAWPSSYQTYHRIARTKRMVMKRDESELRWKKESSKTVYHDQWLQVRSDSASFPDGRVIDPYYVVEIPDWCNVVVVTKDDKLILVRQYRYAADQVTLELPGGIIEPGETPLNSVRREMEEETGYTSGDIEFLMQVSPNPALHNNTAWFYLARNAEPSGTQQFDALEDLDIVAVSKDELFALLDENKLQHGVQVGAVYKALEKLGWMTRR